VADLGWAASVDVSTPAREIAVLLAALVSALQRRFEHVSAQLSVN
jgi:hypothetical protein